MANLHGRFVRIDVRKYFHYSSLRSLLEIKRSSEDETQGMEFLTEIQICRLSDIVSIERCILIAIFALYFLQFHRHVVGSLYTKKGTEKWDHLEMWWDTNWKGETMKYLAVIIDNRLRFKDHCDLMLKKIGKK